MWICFETLSDVHWQQEILEKNKTSRMSIGPYVFLARHAATKRLALFQASATKNGVLALAFCHRQQIKKQRPQSPRSPNASNAPTLQRRGNGHDLLCSWYLAGAAGSDLHGTSTGWATRRAQGTSLLEGSQTNQTGREA